MLDKRQKCISLLHQDFENCRVWQRQVTFVDWASQFACLVGGSHYQKYIPFIHLMRRLNHNSDRDPCNHGRFFCSTQNPDKATWLQTTVWLEISFISDFLLSNSPTLDNQQFLHPKHTPCLMVSLLRCQAQWLFAPNWDTGIQQADHHLWPSFYLDGLMICGPVLDILVPTWKLCHLT